MKETILKFNLLVIVFAFCLCPIYGQKIKEDAQSEYRLIAHRGGVVDSNTAENSIEALKKASNSGYWMVEIDLRLTKDSVLIIHHDSNFKRYFGVDLAVSEMEWEEIKELNGVFGNKVLSFEEALKFCQENNLQVMVDNKIRGKDDRLFGSVVELLEKYELLENALMIGTEESTPFFTGKVKLSCTRQQLEENMLKSDFNSNNYYLFSGNISKEDVEWTKSHGILTVGVVNEWTFKEESVMEKAQEGADRLKEAGVKHFQIDSMFESFFR